MQTIDLMQNNFKIPPLVYMVQNDTGRTLKMNIRDNTLEAGDTAEVAINRSDGSYYTISATRVIGENAFSADMTQALTQPGLTKCQLKVTSSSLVVSTYMFGISVEASTDGVSEEQLGVSVQDLIEAAQQLTLSDNDVKLALLQIAEKVAYTDQDGAQYYADLLDALYPPIRATGVTLDKNSLGFNTLNVTQELTATITPNNVEDPTVIWGTSDSDVAVVSDGLVTSVGLGVCTITATCGTKHASCSVNVATVSVVSISASYTQSGTVYDNDTLDSLKSDLIVTATYSDSTTGIVPPGDYTLSGSLDYGTSTITVNYGGQTDTFTVSVAINSDFEQFDYLTNTATSGAAGTSGADYVDTGIIRKWGVLNVEFEAVNSNGQNGAEPIIGANNGTSSAIGNMLWYARASKAGFSTFTLGVATQLSTVPGDTRAVCKYFFVDGGASYLEWNGTTVQVATKSAEDVPTINKSMILYGGREMSANNRPYSSAQSRVKLGYVKFTDPATNLVVYNFIPVKKTATGKVGYYDTVEKVFYEQHGTSLAAGYWS